MFVGGGACVFSCHDLSVFSEKGGEHFEEGRRGQIWMTSFIESPKKTTESSTW